jgi:hypothetical protein
VTGISIGTVFVYCFANRFKLADILFITFAIMAYPNYSLSAWHIGNNFYPSPIVLRESEPVHVPSIFSYQKWMPEVSLYYQSIDRDFKELKDRSCGLEYLLNDTSDNFIAALSPFKQYQIAPNGQWLGSLNSHKLNSALVGLRPDYDIEQKILQAQDLLIAKSFENMNDLDAYQIPPGYSIYRQYQSPNYVFYIPPHTVFILTPKKCI